MYALVEIKGKQYRVEKDAVLQVDRLEEESGSQIEFGTVMLIGGEKGTTIGTPYVDGAVVKAEVSDHVRGDKIRVFKHKRRKNYRRTKGHRQHFSTVTIRDIVAGK